MKEYMREYMSFYILVGITVAAGLVGNAVGLGVSLVGYAFLLYKREYTLLLFYYYVIILLSDSFDLFPFAVQAKPIISLLTFVIGIVLYTKAKVPYKMPTLAMIPFFLIAVVALFFNPNLEMSIQKTLSYILIFFGMPGFFLYDYHKRGDKVAKDWILFFFVIFIASFILRVFLPEYGVKAERLSGIFGNPNGFGLFLIVSFLFYQFTMGSKLVQFSKNLRRAMEISFILALLLTQSRNAIAVFLLFYVFKAIYARSQISGWILFIIILGSYSFILTQIPKWIVALGLEEFFRLETLEEGSGRLVAWDFAWENIQKNFFIGSGISYTEFLYRKYYVYLSTLGHQGNAHNTFLTVWLDTGLVGLIAFIGGILAIFLRAARKSPLAIPILFALLFSMNFESWLSASLNPFTTVFLFIIVLLSLEHKTKKNDSAISPEKSA